MADRGGVMVERSEALTRLEKWIALNSTYPFSSLIYRRLEDSRPRHGRPFDPNKPRQTADANDMNVHDMMAGIGKWTFQQTVAIKSQPAGDHSTSG